MSTDPIIGSARSILCVEPDARAREELEKALRGHRLTFALNAYDAIRDINSHLFDLYVLEFWLPDWSGVQLCRHIKKSDPAAPVVFCTSARDPAHARAMRAGAAAVCEKPIDRASVRMQVNALLERAAMGSLSARVAEELAIAEELQRCARAAAERAQNARGTAERAMERTARVKAARAFLQSGGTRADFERWWPQVFGSMHAGFMPDER